MTATQQPDPFGSPPPEADRFGAPQTKGPSGPRAGFWMRFGAAFIDGLLISIVTVPFTFIDPAVYYVVNILVAVCYYTVLEGGPTGQTVGKRALGIRVIDLARGGPIGYGRGFIRYIGRYASTIVFLLGYFWMLWDKEKQTWHDKLAGSVVVPTSSYPVG